MLINGKEKLERMRDGRIVYIGGNGWTMSRASGVPQLRANHRCPL